MTGIIFAILASVSFAFGYTALKRSYSDFPPSVAFFLDMVLGLLIWIPFGLSGGIDVTHFSTVLLYSLVNAVLAEAFFFYILSKGEISITGTILASYPIYTVLLSFFVNNERLSLLAWSLVLLTIFGTVVLSLPSQVKKKELHKTSFIVWAVVGALAIGFSDTLNKHIIAQTSASTFVTALALIQIPVAVVYLLLEKQSLKQFGKIFTHLPKYQFSILGAFCNVIGMLFLMLSFQYTLASFAAPISASYPAIMIFLAVVWLKEKLTKKDIVGVLLVLAGIIGISFLIV